MDKHFAWEKNDNNIFNIIDNLEHHLFSNSASNPSFNIIIYYYYWCDYMFDRQMFWPRNFKNDNNIFNIINLSL